MSEPSVTSATESSRADLRRFAPIDIAILPIGAYEPRWFMKYQEVAQAERKAVQRTACWRHFPRSGRQKPC